VTTNNGLLLVDKPAGITSHDVVARVRRILCETRVGHAGTLDPMATGLLVLGVGPSTRLLRFAQGGAKRYRGVVTFGTATDSLDADGTVVERREAPTLTSGEVSARAAQMLGPQLQVPPMVSAIQVRGRRLYDLAREGIEVEREARPITVEAFSLAPTTRAEQWTFDVTCSVGTYVRVLLSDLAGRLGTVGHLSALRRIASGPHRVESAVTLDELEVRVRDHATVLQPALALVAHLEQAEVSLDDERRLRMGQRVTLEAANADEAAAINVAGSLVAIVRRRGETWQPVVVLPPESTSERE